MIHGRQLTVTYEATKDKQFSELKTYKELAKQIIDELNEEELSRIFQCDFIDPRSLHTQIKAAWPKVTESWREKVEQLSANQQVIFQVKLNLF